MTSSREDLTSPGGIAHGVSRLPAVIVEDYNVELRDADGFVGDRASNRAFREIVEGWRKRLRKVGDDPLGDTPTSELSKKKLDKVLTEGDAEAAAVVQGASAACSSRSFPCTIRTLRGPIRRNCFCAGVSASSAGSW